MSGLKLFAFFGGAALIAFGGALLAKSLSASHAKYACCETESGIAALPVMYELPEFALTERTRQTVTRDDLKGRVWIADFVFTRCPGPCPIMSGRMAHLQKYFAEAPDLQLVTITVDPAFDTPEVLQDYARRYRADGERWLFLTGEPKQVYELAVKGFRMGAPTFEGEPADSDHPITHSTKFVLVDREGRIRGYYEGTEAAGMDRLKKDAGELLKEKPATQPADST